MIRQHAGQVLVAGFSGHTPPTMLLSQAARGRLAGVILFRRNVVGVPEVAQLNRELLAAFPQAEPGLIAVDQEGGRVARLSNPVIELPSMSRLAACNDPELTRRVAYLLSTQLRDLGFNLNMAPVLDVHTNPDNPIIGDRSFGTNAEQVILHGRAMLEGMAQAGIAACGKHFPGHGDTAVDSHLALPRVRHDRSRLNAVELRPFAELCPHLPALMTAHLVMDALDPHVPATMSKPIVTDLLRGTFGFEGCLFSDDLEMRAVADDYGLSESGCAAIAAGCDALLICSQEHAVEAVYEALVLNAERDSSFASRLAEAAERTMRLRRGFANRVTFSAATAAEFEARSESLAVELAAKLAEL